jgi:hypothetical protein
LRASASGRRGRALRASQAHAAARGLWVRRRATSEDSGCRRVMRRPLIERRLTRPRTLGSRGCRRSPLRG